MGNFKDLSIYKKSFENAMDIFQITKRFPGDEKYGLTSQIRRSSRSVCANMAEGYRKRRYKAHFISKLTDSDMENTETMVWIDFAFSCGYIDKDLQIKLYERSEEIGKILSYMIDNPDKFIWKG